MYTYLSLLFCLFGSVSSFQFTSQTKPTYSTLYMNEPSNSDKNSNTEPKTFISYNKIPPKYEKKMPLKAQWLPIINMNAPEILDGSFAGDVGFDPCGFAKSENALYWMREAEIKHARLAMLAAVGWPLSELWHEKIADFFHLDSILAEGGKAPSILNGGLSSTYASDILFASIVVAAFLENKSLNTGEVFWNAKKSEDYIPGDYKFDPLNLYNIKGNKKIMETAEIKHGRLAMIAIVTYVVEEILTGLPVVQQTPYLF